MAMLLMFQLGVTKVLDAQKNFWSLYPTVINFTAGGATSTLPGTLIPLTSYYAENSVHLDGTLQFYVRNGGSFEIMDRFGNTYAPANNTISNKELEIVPVPGSCDTYCVMFTAPFTISTSKFSFFEVQVKGDGTLNVYPVQNKTTNYTGPITGIAVSKRTGSSADRDIYIVSGTYVDRYVISNTGINFDQQYDLSSYHYDADDIYEADLSPDGQYLGWGSSDKDVYIMETVGGALNEITLSGPLFVQQITGVEFHTVVEGGTSLYASMSGSGVFEIDDFTTVTPTITAIPSSRYLGTSQLELALDGLIYCVESQNGRLSTIDPLSHTINTLTTPVTSSDSPNLLQTWALPQQVDGEGDALFYGVDPPAISGLNIEMTALPLVVSGAPTFFNCSSLGLDYTASGTYDGVAIEIVSVDPTSGTPIMGLAYLNYSTSLPSPVTLPLDLRCLDDAINCDLFDDFLGQTFRITVTLKGEDCGTEASTQGFFEVFGAPTPISVDFKMQPTLIGQPLCQSSTVSTACVVGNQGLSFTATNSTGDITYYRFNIREVDCTTGAPVGSPLLQGSNVNIASIAGLYGNLNTLVINGSPAYFADNPSLVDGKCFKIQLVLGNICDEYSATNFFFVDPNEYLQSNDPNRAATANAQKDKRHTEEILGQPFFYPNPFTQDFSLQLTGKHDSEYSLRLVNLNGQTIHQQQGKLTEGAVDISAPDDLPSGVYFYLLQLDADQPYAGRIVKQ